MLVVLTGANSNSVETRMSKSGNTRLRANAIILAWTNMLVQYTHTNMITVFVNFYFTVFQHKPATVNYKLNSGRKRNHFTNVTYNQTIFYLNIRNVFSNLFFQLRN